MTNVQFNKVLNFYNEYVCTLAFYAQDCFCKKERPILSNEASLLVVKEGLEPSTPGL